MTRNLPIRKFGNVERRTFAKIEEVQPMPYLIEIQRDSYRSFIEEGISEVFEDYSPITDYSDRFELYFLDHSLSDKPKYDEKECRDRVAPSPRARFRYRRTDYRGVRRRRHA